MIATNSHRNIFGEPKRKEREDQQRKERGKEPKKKIAKRPEKELDQSMLKPEKQENKPIEVSMMEPKKETNNDCLKIKIEEVEIEFSGWEDFKIEQSHTKENLSPENQQSVAQDNDDVKTNANQLDVDRHQQPKFHRCKTCGKILSRRQKLIYHMKTHTRKKIVHKCDQCGEIISHRSKLIIHLRKHTGEKAFKCPKCGKLFAFKSGVWKHEKTCEIVDGSDNSEKLKIYCEQCGKSFYHQSYLVRHVKGHNGIKDYQCNKCEKGFTSHPSLAQHIDVIHLGKKSFVCNECGETFGRRATMKIHFLKHTKELPFGCKHCSERFRANVVLKKHMRKTHPGENMM